MRATWPASAIVEKMSVISARSAASGFGEHTTTTRSACRSARRVHAVMSGSVCSTTWSLPTSASCMNSARRGTPTLSVDACEIAVRLSTRSTRSLERCLVDPKRAISEAISATSAPASQFAVTAMVSDEARSNLRCDGLRSRTRMRRVTLSIIDGDNATSSSNVAAENEASVVSRTARTVPDRGARSSRPSSPTTSPRPSSATSRSSPSSTT